MSASKTNYYQGIVLALKAMWKTCTKLSSKVNKLEEEQKKVEQMETKLNLIASQHIEVVANLKAMANMQNEIAQQILLEHEKIEELYKALGLKKDLSYYSYNIMDAQEH